MIKLRAFLISIILVLITLFILDKTYIKKIEDYYKVNDNSMRYNTSYEKYKSKDMILENMTPNTVLLLFYMVPLKKYIILSLLSLL